MSNKGTMNESISHCVAGEIVPAGGAANALHLDAFGSDQVCGAGQ
jgi:hypothetical protein